MPEFVLRTKLEPPFGNHYLQTLGLFVLELKIFLGLVGILAIATLVVLGWQVKNSSLSTLVIARKRMYAATVGQKHKGNPQLRQVNWRRRIRGMST